MTSTVPTSTSPTTPVMDEYLLRLQATMESLDTAVPTLKALIYGVSGVGKTVHSLMIAQDITPLDKEILYIDTAEGWVSLENHPGLKSRVQRMRYVNLNQLEALCRGFRAEAEVITRFGTVILDESSSAADLALDEVLKYRAGQDRTKDPDTPTQPDYNTTTNRVRKTYLEMLTLHGVNVIMVSHTRKDKDNRNIEKESPSFLPKLGQKIKQPLHLIAQLSGNEIKGDDGKDQYIRVFQVHPTKTIDAKCRIGGLPPQVEYPQFISRTKEWLAGTVPDNHVNAIVPDRDLENPTSNAIEIEE